MIITRSQNQYADWSHNSCQSHFSNSITLRLFSVAGWRLHNYIISTRAQPRHLPSLLHLPLWWVDRILWSPGGLEEPEQCLPMEELHYSEWHPVCTAQPVTTAHCGTFVVRLSAGLQLHAAPSCSGGEGQDTLSRASSVVLTTPEKSAGASTLWSHSWKKEGPEED